MMGGTESKGGGIDKSSYGQLKIEIYKELTRENCLQLSTLFDLCPADHDRIEHSESPGVTLLQVLEEKAVFSKDSCTALYDGLKRIGMHKAAAKLEKWTTNTHNIEDADLKEKTKSFVGDLKLRYQGLHKCKQTTHLGHTRALQGLTFIDVKLAVVDQSRGRREDDQQTTLSSFLDIFTNSAIKKEKRIIIEGESGFGKTTLAVQLAYYWSIDKKPLKDVKIFILLQLNQMKGVSSVYEAVRKQLPIDSTLTVDDITVILRSNAESCVFILDSWDEYIDDTDPTRETDFLLILRNMMLVQSRVILTTRPSSYRTFGECPHIRLRLQELTAAQRQTYISTVFSSRKEEMTKLNALIEENDFLTSLCGIPMLFVLVIHSLHEDIAAEDNPGFNRVTVLFQRVVDRFLDHLDSKHGGSPASLNDPVDTSADSENLCELAYKGLCSDESRTKWAAMSLGLKSLDFWTDSGIFVKEEVEIGPSFPSPGTNVIRPPLETSLQVKFVHLMFQEWFAAHHLTTLVLDDINFFKNQLQGLNPKQFVSILPFICGLEPKSTYHILEYLLTLKDEWPNPVMDCMAMCLAEHGGDKQHLLGLVELICKKSVSFYNRNSRILQSAKILLLQTASDNGIPIGKVSLCGVIKAVTEDGVTLESGLSLPPLLTVESYFIGYKRKEKPDCNRLLPYMAQSKSLQRAWFYHHSLKPSSKKPVLPLPLPEDAKVFWFSEKCLTLDLKRGKWVINEQGEARRTELGETFVLDICLLD
ncbi:NLR family CARD domain-containing protein 4 [Holothuria leucospilota]|uniref:NLR family CARD domain-containing protein 4 n=1 Tax=Holothuria leucospilota TaxID=206669 RepID=A0A9Q1H2U2_HOLLE|nr:NLR family CARD domain-containing protein 4 [Holothuria leucospilota]